MPASAWRTRRQSPARVGGTVTPAPGLSGAVSPARDEVGSSSLRGAVSGVASGVIASSPRRSGGFELFRRRGSEPGKSLDVGGKVRHLPDLAHVDNVPGTGWAAFGPLDRLFPGLHLDHPITAQGLCRP